MLSYEVYKTVHFVSIAFMVLALGGASILSIGGEDLKEHPARKLIGITHGIAMFGILLGGFGMLARLGIISGGLPAWIYAKLVLWFLLGASLGIAMRVPGAGKVLWGLVPVLVALTGWIALTKPF